MFNFFSSRMSVAPVEDNTIRNTLTPLPEVERNEKTDTAPRMTTAERIDAGFAAIAAVNAEKVLLDSKRRLRFNLDITPADEEWILFQELLIEALSPQHSVEGILQKYFEEGQRLAFVPPLVPGSIPDFQEKSGQEYRKLLASDSRFEGQPDNLLTKLTMLHFGLPIAPLTVQNLLRRFDCPDEDDPPENPKGFQTVQRIENSERALEFLNDYNERAYDYKILRHAKPSQPIRLGPSIDLTKRFNNVNVNLISISKQPGVHDRGGATPKGVFSYDREKEKGYIYNLLGGRLPVGDNVESFVAQALKLLSIDKKSDWNFSVQQYDNREGKKHLVTKPTHDIGVGASTKVTKDDTSAWDMLIRPRVMNANNDCAMVVHTSGQSTKTPEKLYLADIDGVGKLAETQSLETIGLGGLEAGRGFSAANSSRSTFTAPIYNLDYETLEVENHVDSFVCNALHLADIDPVKENLALVLRISAYCFVEKRGQYVFSQQISFLGGNYRKHIATKLFASNQPSKQWKLIVHHRDDKFVPRVFEPEVSKGSWPLLDFYVRGKRLELEASDEDLTSQVVFDGILDQLDLTDTPKYKVAVDVYTREALDIDWAFRETHEFSHKSVDSAFDRFYDDQMKTLKPGSPFESAIRLNARPAGEEPDGEWGRADKLEYTNVHVWGFGGNISELSTKEQTLDAAQRILRLHPDSDTSFHITIFDFESNRVFRTREVTNWSFQQFFDTEIENRSSEGVAHLFVSPENVGFTSCMPSLRRKDVVHLRDDSTATVAYWRIPEDLNLKDYGINQLQADFRRAMKVHWPAWEERSNSQVIVQGINIGHGGMDLSTELFRKLKSDYIALSANTTTCKAESEHVLYYQITLDEDDELIDNLGVTLVGSPHITEVLRNDFENLANLIDDHSIHFPDKKSPSQYTIWKTARHRETLDDPGEKLNYGHDEAHVEALREWFFTQPQDTSNIVFRPKWATIRVEKFEDPTGYVAWDCENNSELFTFREALSGLFGEDELEMSDVSIIEPKSDHCFILSADTSGHDWRVHIFDWFHASKLQVRLINPVNYKIREDSYFGLPSERISKLINEKVATLEAKKVAAIPHEPFEPISGNTRFPRDRTSLADVAERNLAPTWNTWMASENIQDKPQLSAYIRDQPIVQAGPPPEDTIFGMTSEKAIAVGDQTPTAYGQHLTLTDISRLKDQVRTLRNQVLQREITCFICDTQFEAFQKEEIAAHYNEHQNALQSAGNCVLCGDNRWKLMTADQKRDHLHQHQAREEGQISKDIWKGFECPGCDEDLFKYENVEKILEHVISHDPLTIKFCARCSRSYRHLSERELDHHNFYCLGSREKRPGEPDQVFCESCAGDVTGFTETQMVDHYADCVARAGRVYCSQCAWETTVMSEEDFAAHKASCKPVGGVKGTYCQRCGENKGVSPRLGQLPPHHACRSGQYYENTIFTQLKAKEDQLQAREIVLQAEQAALSRDRATHTRNAAHLTRNLNILKSIRNLNEEQRSYLSKFEEDANEEQDRIGICPFPSRRESIGCLSKGDIVNHARAHLSAEDGEFGSFECPLEIEEGRCTANCGKLLSLLDAGQHLRAHYVHREGWEKEDSIGKNASRFKRRRSGMEEETKFWERVAKKARKPGGAAAKRGGKGKALEEAAEAVEDSEGEEIQGDGTHADDISTVAKAKAQPLAGTESIESFPNNDGEARPSTGCPPAVTRAESKPKTKTKTNTKATGKSKGKGSGKTKKPPAPKPSFIKKPLNKTPSKCTRKNPTTNSDDDSSGDLYTASPTPSASNSFLIPPSPTPFGAVLTGSAAKKGPHRNFKGSRLADTNFHPSGNDDSDLDDEPNSAKVAEELAKEPLAVTSPGKRPPPGRMGRDEGGQKRAKTNSQGKASVEKAKTTLPFALGEGVGLGISHTQPTESEPNAEGKDEKEATSDFAKRPDPRGNASADLTRNESAFDHHFYANLEKDFERLFDDVEVTTKDGAFYEVRNEKQQLSSFSIPSPRAPPPTTMQSSALAGVSREESVANARHEFSEGRDGRRGVLLSATTNSPNLASRISFASPQAVESRGSSGAAAGAGMRKVSVHYEDLGEGEVEDEGKEKKDSSLLKNHFTTASNNPKD